MPDGVMIVEVPSHPAKPGPPAKLDLRAVEGELFHPDGRTYEQSEWPIMRSINGEKVTEEESPAWCPKAVR